MTRDARHGKSTAVEGHFSRVAVKKPSGAYVPESQRSTVQVKLRLPPDVAEDLDELASRWGVTRSGAVAHLLEVAAGTSLSRLG